MALKTFRSGIRKFGVTEKPLRQPFRTCGAVEKPFGQHSQKKALTGETLQEQPQNTPNTRNRFIFRVFRVFRGHASHFRPVGHLKLRDLPTRREHPPGTADEFFQPVRLHRQQADQNEGMMAIVIGH